MAYGYKIAKGSAKKSVALKRRHIRVRKRVNGTAERPRLVVTRSNRHIVAQIVNDKLGHTLASASTMESTLRTSDGKKVDLSREVGKLVAERAKAAGVSEVVFDRGGNKYHGRVAAVAEGARDAGLDF
jgi:large subunit ribosomal protein L18